jgi:hypothetical protein
MTLSSKDVIRCTCSGLLLARSVNAASSRLWLLLRAVRTKINRCVAAHRLPGALPLTASLHRPRPSRLRAVGASGYSAKPRAAYTREPTRHHHAPRAVVTSGFALPTNTAARAARLRSCAHRSQSPSALPALSRVYTALRLATGKGLLQRRRRFSATTV